MPGAVLNVGDMAVNKTDKNLECRHMGLNGKDSWAPDSF